MANPHAGKLGYPTRLDIELGAEFTGGVGRRNDDPPRRTTRSGQVVAFNGGTNWCDFDLGSSEDADNKKGPEPEV